MKTRTTIRLLALSITVLALTCSWPGSARAAAPVLDPISNMTIGFGGCAPSTSDQAIRATDADGNAITFTFSGPAWMTVTSDPQVGNTRTGNIHLTSPPNNPGPTPASVTATANGESDTKSFTISIVVVNQAPVLTQPANMTVQEGATADQALHGTDACAAPLTFFKVSGPTFLTVTTVNATTGNLHVAPAFADAGTYMATVQASNGTTSDQKSFTITVPNVNRPPVLNPIASMTIPEGSTRNQVVTASDPDGDALTFSKASGPTFMTVTTTSPSSGNIHLAPGFVDAGSYAAAVTASDPGGLSDTRSFTILVCNGCQQAPVMAPPGNMTVNEGATANQTLSATDPDGSALQFSKVSGPAFMTVTTTTPGTGTATGNVNLSPGFSDSGTYSAAVAVSNGALSDTRSFSITINNMNGPPTLDPIANMLVPEGSARDQTVTGTDPEGEALTFSKASGPTFMSVTTITPTSGNIHVTPGFAEPGGTFSASVTATDPGGLSATRSFVITLCLGCTRAPVLQQPANMTVVEGETADQTLTASDPDGDFLTFSKFAGPFFMIVTTTNPATATGNVHLAPGFADAGTYAVGVRASDGVQTDSKSFTITVLDSGNRCPTANPGGPYSGITGVPVSFDGTASSDPDGDPLTYAWDFDASDGITIDAVGAMVSDTYGNAGTYVVTLTVRDASCAASATTTADILTACPATVFNGYDVIRLNSGKPTWFAFVQPASGCYTNSDVVPSSFVLKYAGNQIPIDPRKAFVVGDKNGDGIPDIRVNFSKTDLRTLFAGLSGGHNLVDVTIEANLTTGGTLQGTTQVDVVATGGGSAATVSPNPFNPSGALSFTTSRPGSARVELFDVGGRLVRRVVDESSLGSGVHEVRIDGRGARGESLASGIYFIRGVSVDGKFTKTITILK